MIAAILMNAILSMTIPTCQACPTGYSVCRHTFFCHCKKDENDGPILTSMVGS